ncbi:hypothetical protein [Delftia sp.]|uniref:hypothetical protein n=1 Tax=Delftia sp. TaxID=1886637 RepID=UPI00259CE788|nr:hypothetical protein [Delftia sp.]
MMQEWLRTLDDDAIADWANKGLLKRGAKALAAVDAAAVGAGGQPGLRRHRRPCPDPGRRGLCHAAMQLPRVWTLPPSVRLAAGPARAAGQRSPGR